MKRDRFLLFVKLTSSKFCAFLLYGKNVLKTFLFRITYDKILAEEMIRLITVVNNSTSLSLVLSVHFSIFQRDKLSNRLATSPPFHFFLSRKFSSTFPRDCLTLRYISCSLQSSSKFIFERINRLSLIISLSLP